MEGFDAARFRRKSLAVCPSKRSYTTWAEARKVAVRSRREHGWDVVQPYRCPGCGRYHVGHPPEVEGAA